MDYSIFANACESHSNSDPSSRCFLDPLERGQRDAIAGVRIVVSLLSLMGSSSIIVSAISKKQVFSPKVQPILVLSIADFLLSVLWVVGGSVWLRDVGPARVGCFTVQLLTVILVCVAINLTLVYALLALATVKQSNPSLLVSDTEQHPWGRLKLTVVYITAWFLPTVIIMTIFGGFNTGETQLVPIASECSCWCLPVFGNIAPFAKPLDNTTTYFKYMKRLEQFIATYAAVIGIHYLVVFLLMLAIYWKVLRHIRAIRLNLGQDEKRSRPWSLYGAMESVVISGENQAKKRISYFLTVFLLTGLANFILSFAVVTAVYTSDDTTSSVQIPSYFLAIYILQSISLPIQGFLNAIVYGWTRDDFIQVMVHTTNNRRNSDVLMQLEEEEEVRSQGIEESMLDQERMFINSQEDKLSSETEPESDAER